LLVFGHMINNIAHMINWSYDKLVI
jgi:hypothetical protein